MSPEQASGREVDGRSDLYSLGVVLYQSLTGAYPHKGETPLMTLHKVITEPPPPLRSLVPVPGWVEEATGRCLEKDPNSRIQNGAELIRILRHGNGTARPPAPRGSHGSAKPATQRPASRVPVRRRTGMIAAAIISSLLVLGSVLWYASTLFIKPPPVPVPDISGSTRKGAEARIAQAGLAVAAVERRWGSPEQHDLVIDQRPAAGSKVPRGSRVVLVLGIGKTVVPDLIGAGIGDAVELLQKNSLAIGETTRVAGPPEQRDRIILMYPQPGTEVGTDAKINLSIGE
jgi:serine/threonine-protein kinase